MVDILSDQAVSDVVLIGHGSLSSVYLDDGKTYNWHDVALAATHLKKGVIIQRFCSNNLRKLSVPLGTFAASEHSNVIATVDRTFDPDHDASDEELLGPVTDSSLASYDEAKARFPINKKWQSWVQSRGRTQT